MRKQPLRGESGGVQVLYRVEEEASLVEVGEPERERERD